ncbi:hypothetical protein [Bacillus cereus]|uniref:hypothetical protein n=2 Tax=Bacillus cereus group TaxID=86661 RepID=UPI001F3A68E9|nr:hypothetical protein [Bacillus cereus]BCC55144.1 hypothetical protein BCJMU07_4494 [Bacillus cereus]
MEKDILNELLSSKIQNDRISKSTFLDLVDGIEYSDRRVFTKKLLENAGLGHVNVSMENISAYGVCEGTFVDNPIKITNLKLLQSDIRSEAYQIQTILHEFFHANLDGLSGDASQIGEDEWIMMEEVATETAAHSMVELMDFHDEMMYSYGNFLIEILPRLKQLNEFKDCNVFKDFGYKFLKYRFSQEFKTGEWKGLFNECSKVKIDIIDYAEQYRKDVYTHKSEIIKLIFDQLHYPDKLDKKDAYLEEIEKSIELGWKSKNIKEPGFYESLCIVMNRKG